MTTRILQSPRSRWRLTLNREQLQALREALNGKPGEQPLTVMDIIAYWQRTKKTPDLAAINTIFTDGQ